MCAQIDDKNGSPQQIAWEATKKSIKKHFNTLTSEEKAKKLEQLNVRELGLAALIDENLSLLIDGKNGIREKLFSRQMKQLEESDSYAADSAQAFVELSKEWALVNRYREAEELGEKAVSKDKKIGAWAFYNLARLHGRMQNYKEAEKFAQKTTEFCLLLGSQTYIELADLYLEENNPQKGNAFLEKALSLLQEEEKAFPAKEEGIVSEEERHVFVEERIAWKNTILHVLGKMASLATQNQEYEKAGALITTRIMPLSFDAGLEALANLFLFRDKLQKKQLARAQAKELLNSIFLQNMMLQLTEKESTQK